MPTNPQPPIAKKITHKINVHGQEIKDDFAWLRDKEWPQIVDNNILEYLNLENDYAQLFLTPKAEQIEHIYHELKSRVKLTDQTPYHQKKKYLYYARTEEDQSYPIYCRKYSSMEGPEEIILNVNDLAQGYEFINVTSLSISPDNNKLAYAVDYSGGERYEIRVLDLQTQMYHSDKIVDTIGSIVWHQLLNGFFYTKVNESWRPYQVLFHKLGSLVKDDQLILQEDNPLYNLGVDSSSDNKYVFINSSGHNDNECYYVNNNDTEFKPSLIQSRLPNIEYDVEHHNGKFFIITNDISDNFRVVTAVVDSPSSKNWQVFLNPQENEHFTSIDVSKSCLILNYHIDGLSAIKIVNLSNNDVKCLEFDEATFYASSYASNFEEDDIRVIYSSLRQPTIHYKYNVLNKSLSVLKIAEVPGEFNAQDYQVERLYANNNGVLVPISLIYRTDKFKKDGSNPLFLYGYGSYGIAMRPGFNSNIISLLDRGISYAIAHIRGGSDLGHHWYKQAKFLNKKNTFVDFICCSEYLIANNYTSAGNIIISGGSAGGMLIGAVVNSHPELYKAAILHVPFCDVLNTMLDSSLPLTQHEYDEWGNPQDQKYFEYIKSYSPYDNIRVQPYPHMYVTTSLYDSRVGYWEAAKWVAKLRSLKTDNNKLILKIDMNAGHSGASDRFKSMKELAEDYCFIFSLINN